MGTQNNKLNENSALTRTQRKALQALADHGGEGVMTKVGTMLARGVELGHGPDGEGDREEGIERFQRSTWVSLAKLGLIVEISRRRFAIAKAESRS